MHAIGVTETGGPNVLIKAEAIGVNCVDDEFTWRTSQLFDAIASGTVNVNVRAHGRVGSTDALTVNYQ